MKILLAEDDPNLGTLLQEYLTLKGYPADLARDGDEALNQFVKQSYDLCIFDVMMPKKDGFTLAKEVRQANADIPIIFLTAKAMKEDTLQGFRLGGDDYLTKPFNMEELVARMEAILRRSQRNEQKEQKSNRLFQIGTLTFDAERQTLTHGDDVQKLTSREAELLKIFCQHLGQPLSRSYILKAIWGDDSYFNARSMDVYLTKIRKYLRSDERIQLINLHGEGFKMIVD
ncbi:DNA-binding response regulator [Siphonobacter sp. BAB-5385]|uniref:DNA-binding response regulator n=1 Tax=Siphonobacter curvatus TaxID=2094562 RepID=A0A2S7ILY2_9BACT|nr:MULTISPECIES: response regulator transcription factor [Siphonobacter]OZI06693.1 DNA-binding response regulator [Siphonobacter sp. BAB-5385]PQA58656.1 DNA-binding response regulator [Siphonobacter curvatus]